MQNINFLFGFSLTIHHKAVPIFKAARVTVSLNISLIIKYDPLLTETLVIKGYGQKVLVLIWF